MFQSSNATQAVADDHHDDLIPDDSNILMIVFSAVSIVACTSNIIPYLIFPKLRKKVYAEILFYIQICNLASSTGSVLGYLKSYSVGCYWQGFITNVAPVASVFWTIFISLLIYMLIVYGITIKINMYVHIVCWLMPVVTGSFVFINANYLSPSFLDGGWCFVVPNDSTSYFWITFWYWFSFYAWIWLGIAVTFALYLVILCKRELLFQDRTERENKLLWNLIGYPFIIVLSWLVVCVKDTTASTNYKVAFQNSLLMIGVTLACCQGFFTAVYFFVVNREILLREYEGLAYPKLSFNFSYASLSLLFNIRGLNRTAPEEVVASKDAPARGQHHEQAPEKVSSEEVFEIINRSLSVGSSASARAGSGASVRVPERVRHHSGRIRPYPIALPPGVSIVMNDEVSPLDLRPW